MRKNSIILLLVFLCLGCFYTGYSQDWNWKTLSEESNRIHGKLSGKTYYMPATGSVQHFFHNTWHKGNILMEDGDLFENIELRYLAYGDELVCYNPNLSQLFVVDKEKVAAFTVNLPHGKQEFVKLQVKGAVPEYRYFEILYKGNLQLLAFHSVEEVKTGMYHDKQGRLKDTSFELHTSCYMYSEEAGFTRLKPRRSSFLNLFTEKKREVRRLFRKNKVFPVTEIEMVRAFELLDEEGIF